MKKELFGGWLFYLQDKAETSPLSPERWTRDFDDKDWRPVTLPHDWAVDYPFDKKYASGTAYLCGGTGWYRYHFTNDKDASGKRYRLCFDGVYKHCKVWCNGYYIGSHQNGYTSFSLDITEALKHGGEDNVIAVQVRHEDIADSRWYTGSGIDRPVYLKTSGEAHFADGGVFFYRASFKSRYKG